jgi:DNA-binding NarL/FixJ family response regulator
VDLSLGLNSGLQLVKTLNASLPDVKVLILSMHDEKLHAERALAAGASGYIMKHAATQHLIGAIRCVAKTVETHQARIKEKLGLTRVRDLTRAAVSWSLQ